MIMHPKLKISLLIAVAAVASSFAGFLLAVQVINSDPRLCEYIDRQTLMPAGGTLIALDANDPNAICAYEMGSWKYVDPNAVQRPVQAVAPEQVAQPTTSTNP